MDKITRLILTISIVASCSFRESFVAKKFNLIFVYDTFTEIDFNRRQVKIHYDYFKNPFPINFSRLEENMILQSFNNYQIDKINKNISCINKTIAISPSSDFKIKLTKQGKLKSEMIIDYYYQVDSNRKNSEEYRVAMFGNEIIKILENNNDFKKSLSLLHKYENENHLLRL